MDCPKLMRLENPKEETSPLLWLLYFSPLTSYITSSEKSLKRLRKLKKLKNEDDTLRKMLAGKFDQGSNDGVLANGQTRTH